MDPSDQQSYDCNNPDSILTKKQDYYANVVAAGPGISGFTTRTAVTAYCATEHKCAANICNVESNGMGGWTATCMSLVGYPKNADGHATYDLSGDPCTGKISPIGP
jgi:hypothetical protein